MNNSKLNIRYSDLLKRRIIIFLFAGIIFVIIRDKTILTYFLKLETIAYILLFGILGGLFSGWVDTKLIRRINKKRSQ